MTLNGHFSRPAETDPYVYCMLKNVHIYTEVETKEPDAVSPLGPSFERSGKYESEDVEVEHSEYNEGNQMREI